MRRSLGLLSLLVAGVTAAVIGLHAGPAGGGVETPELLKILGFQSEYLDGLVDVDVMFSEPIPPELIVDTRVFPVTVLVELHVGEDYYFVAQADVFSDGAFPTGFCVEVSGPCPPGTTDLNAIPVEAELNASRTCLDFTIGPVPGDVAPSDMSLRVVTLVNSPVGPALDSLPGGGDTVPVGEAADSQSSSTAADASDQDTASSETDTDVEVDATGTDDETDDSTADAIDSSAAAADESDAGDESGATDESESDGGGGGVAIGIGAAAVLLAAGTTTYVRRRRTAGDKAGGDDDMAPPVAATSARGPCHEERLESDEAQTAWEATVKAKGDAETAYTDAMAGGDRDAISAAHSARQEAFDAETEAYAAFQRVWNVYQDCLAGQLDSAHAPPPATETRPREPVTAPQPTSTPPPAAEQTVTSTSHKDIDVEWRVETNKYDNWRVPVGHVRITMDRTTEEFEDWLAEHGTIETQTSDYLAWLSIPLLIVHTATSTEVEATLSLDDVDGLRDASSSQPMFVDGQLKHWVNMEIVIPTQMVGRYCERKWIREDGPWTPTDETRLGEVDEPIESTPIYVRDDYQTARALAEGLAHMLRQAENLETEAAQAQIDLRERCAGG